MPDPIRAADLLPGLEVLSGEGNFYATAYILRIKLASVGGPAAADAEAARVVEAIAKMLTQFFDLIRPFLPAVEALALEQA